MLPPEASAGALAASPAAPPQVSPEESAAVVPTDNAVQSPGELTVALDALDPPVPAQDVVEARRHEDLTVQVASAPLAGDAPVFEARPQLATRVPAAQSREAPEDPMEHVFMPIVEPEYPRPDLPQPGQGVGFVRHGRAEMWQPVTERDLPRTGPVPPIRVASFWDVALAAPSTPLDPPVIPAQAPGAGGHDRRARD